MGKVACQTLHWLHLKLYSRTLMKWGLKLRGSGKDREECEVLDRAMEYAGMIGVEVTDMLMAVHEKV